MSKFKIDYNGNTSSLFDDNLIYDTMLIEHHITYFNDILKTTGIVVLVEVLRAFRFNLSNISPDILCRRWTYEEDDSIDIEYYHNADGSFTLVFETDN